MNVTPMHDHAMLGAKGQMKWMTQRDDGTWAKREWVSEWRPIDGFGCKAIIQAEVRFDDSCNNGHDSFSVCGTIRELGRTGDKGYIAGGQVTKEIAQAFPELEPLLKWHLFDTTGPMHYVSNTVYLAGDRDYNGLRAGERRQLVNGRTGLPCWELMAVRNGDEKIESVHTLDRLVSAEECPELDYVVKYVPSYTEGKGKVRELDAARRTAVWPDATDEELCRDPETLKVMLINRLPALLVAFNAQMRACGFEVAP